MLFLNTEKPNCIKYLYDYKLLHISCSVLGDGEYSTYISGTMTEGSTTQDTDSC
jgi:hypothetical protein